MSETSTYNERLALAAHLHVQMRRHTGRITDTEWMMSNADYAREIIRLARLDRSVALEEAADKLEAVLFGTTLAPQPKPLLDQFREKREQASITPDRRYIGGLR